MTIINVIVNLAGLEIHVTLVRLFKHCVCYLTTGHVNIISFKDKLVYIEMCNLD